ncbi:MAG: NADH-quinone oxidoreductase subunit NuoN, partial [Gammaproteobacteria bacterium]
MTFAPLLPEIALLASACGILILDTFLRERHRFVSYELAQLALIAAAVITIAFHHPGTISALGGHFIRDTLADVLKAFIMLFAFLAFLYGRDYLRARGLFRGEYFVLGLFAVLGMMVMVSAGSLLSLYLGLELLALSLYAMVALARDVRVAVEAAMKYFVLGALASGMLLYGMSMIYGATGSLIFAEIAAALPGLEGNVILVLGLVFAVVGLAFKLGAVPFHMWIPDVYHGSPTAVTLFLGSVPKLAAFAMAIRLLAEGLPALHGDWQGMLIILAVLSMAVGNIVAIAQSNLKRMLAYSTISHVGFLLLGILAGTRFGYTASLFYTLAYALMALGAFGMILLLSRSGFEADRLEDFRGLNERSPWYAFIMLVFMFSMAGVPPSVGFFAKLYVLQAVVDVDMVWLAVAAVVFSVIGAFYYLRVVKLMYFDKPLDYTPLMPGC